VEAIANHENLTTENPCVRYGLSLLNGDDGEFRDAQHKLQISEASWVTKQLVLAQVEAGTSLDDGGFRGHISQLLSVLDSHPVVLNRGLANILDRYRESAVFELHSALRDFAVSKWGNPWLSSNSARWNLVSEATRSMVADWLKLELIHNFFSLLAEDRTSDTRRLRFWQRYHKHIDDMYFALGRRAAKSTSPDFQELRKRMAGRVLGLDSAGASENNAFIMCIGNYVVVEFGIKGNACFIFKRSELPFNLGGHVAGDATALKHPSYVERLLHTHQFPEPWEKTFETVLARLLSIRPSDADAIPLGLSGPSASPAPFVRQPMNHPTSAGLRIDPVYSRQKLERFCAGKGFRVRDLTGVGGNLWIETSDKDESISPQLRAWGFSHRKGRGWWRRGG
jgi:hypothetical protein